MLKRNQCRFRIQSNRILPFFLNKKKWEDIISELLKTYEESIGQPYHYLENKYQPFYQISDNTSKIIDGLIHIIEKKIELKEFNREEIEKKRSELFKQSADLFTQENDLSYTSYIEKATFIKKENFPVVYCDLKDNQIIEKTPSWTTDDCINRYNISLIQGLLSFAKEIKIQLDDIKPQSLRYLLRYFSFMGFLYEVSKESPLTIRLSGTLDNLSTSSRYKFKLASIAGILPQLSHYKLNALIHINDVDAYLNIDEKSPLKSHFRPFFEYTPPEIESFIEKISPKLEKENFEIQNPQLPKCEVKDWNIADYNWKYKDKSLELFIFSKSQHKMLVNFLPKLQAFSQSNRHVIVMVDKNLEKNLDSYDYPYFITFKDIPSSQKFLMHIKKYLIKK